MTQSKQDKILALKEKHAKELAELEREESLREILPIAVRDNARIHRGAYGEMWVKIGDSYRPTYTLFEAVDLLSSFGEPLECHHLKGSCTKIVPECMVTKKDEETTEISGVSTHVIDLDNLSGNSCQLVAWFNLGGTICEVFVIFRVVHAWLPTNMDMDKEGIKYNWRWHGIGEDSYINWWSTYGHYHRSFCWANKENFFSWLGSSFPGSDELRLKAVAS